MISIAKGACPAILSENAEAWLREWLADKTNNTKRYRYRHVDIKDALNRETFNKCAYCESQIGVAHPGETEHKVPSSKAEMRHFDWTNLTRACTECNRRKNDYYDAHDAFVDPYEDDVTAFFEHHGPIVWWVDSNRRAEIAVKTLELNERERLILSKRDALMSLKESLARYEREDDQTLKEVLRLGLLKKAEPDNEYSAMISAVLARKGIL